ncbi:hypothetical protein EDP2_3983 [Enterobacter cloacae S611]|uniref:Uncharacterized protein n=1 Tax=Enterobacter cloacae S611 TaxID=1399146 RepID=A0ABP2ZRX1_ENTCL|nr:hypothetical protein EDP2_3983 [Enterobacter cloacae S611]
MTIKGDGRQIFQLRQFSFLFRDLRLRCAQCVDLVVARVNVNFVVYRIEDQIVAVFHLSGDATGAHNRRQLKGARHDRRVGGTAANVGDKAEHFFQVQLCGFGRCQIGCNQDDFILNGAQIDNRHTQNVAQQAFTNVAHVSGALFQVFVVQLFQGGCLTFDNFMGCRVGSHALIFNQGYDFLLQLLIFQQHDVAFEDGFFFFAESFTCFRFDRFQLRRCLGTTAQETLNFLINLVGRNFLPVDDDLIFFQQKCFAESDTRGC